jgi:hypothetical protein
VTEEGGARDVSLRDHLDGKLAALDRHLTSEIAALRRETTAANVNAERAIKVAAHEATDRLAAHNGLIDKMEEQATHFATRESVEDFKDAEHKRLSMIESAVARLYGGLLVIAVIGVTNLVKVWSG